MNRAFEDEEPIWRLPIDRVGLLIGVGYFLVSVTIAGVMGFESAWWVNVKANDIMWAYLGILLGAILLVGLRRWPREVFFACGALAFLLYGFDVTLGLPTVLMALIALFGATLWTYRRFGFLALAVSLASLGLALVMLYLRFQTFPTIEGLVRNGVAIGLLNSSGVVVLTWAVADQIRAAGERRDLREESDTHAAEAAAHQEAEREARGQVEALADRQRIAREMHDIVAHGLSVMIVQADGARFAAAADPEAATNALATIASTGRASLAEMRRLLGVLRDDTAPVPEGPQPGLADIAALVGTLSDSGRDVRLSVSGSVPPSGEADVIGLTAYRIVQESLTNVMKHAGEDATAWVTVGIEATRVVIEVVDDGPGGAVVSGGHGLRGMEERVEMLGGHLVTGPDPRGGFRVLATLPREEANA